MSSSLDHQSFACEQRLPQSLRNDRCQNILFKAVFEHFIETKDMAALLLVSKSFQNSSFGANLVVNFVVDKDTTPLLESVLSPSSCLSMQFVPSIHIQQKEWWPEEINNGISNFVGDIVKTKYLHLSLRSLILEQASESVVSAFFSHILPELQHLTLENCGIDDDVMETISKKATKLRTVNLSRNAEITDAGLEHFSNLSGITSLNLSCCELITDVGLEHISKLFNITSLELSGCSEITDAGLEWLAKLSSISTLDLTYCDKITDAGIEHLSKLSATTWLNLSLCRQITDIGLEHLSKLSAITWLNLSLCGRITDVGLEHLAKLDGIKFLDITQCAQITRYGKKKLMLKNCVISC